MKQIQAENSLYGFIKKYFIEKAGFYYPKITVGKNPPKKCTIEDVKKEFMKQAVSIENFENSFTVFDKNGEVLHNAATYEECKAWAENYYGATVTPVNEQDEQKANEGQQQPVQGEGFTGGDWEKFIQPTTDGLATTINVGSKRIATLSFVGIEETEANARLIVEAKPMYYALKEFESLLLEGDPQALTDHYLNNCEPILNRINP